MVAISEIYDEVSSLTRGLTGIPSHEDNSSVVDFLEDWLERNTDSDIEIDEKGNVFATKGGGDGSLGLVGHHDVVPPEPSQVNDDGEYIVDVRDGRLYGRGSADMKGALASALLAFRDSDPGCEVVFASFMGEERGGIGARYAIDQGFAVDSAVVIEGSNGYSGNGVVDVAVAHMGRRELEIEFRGKSSHASEVEKGVNAIYRAIDGVEWIRDLELASAVISGVDVEGSVVVTMIEGGDAANMIPGSCGLVVDERYPPGEKVDFSGLDGGDFSIDVVSEVPAMECMDKDFIDTAFGVVDDVQMGFPERVVKPHTTDAGWLSEAGMDCVVIGPSEKGEAHTAVESVSIDSLVTCYEIYREIANRY